MPRRLVSPEVGRVCRGRTFDALLYELEARDLPLGLAVRPGQGDRGAHGDLVICDATCEGGDEACAGALNPWHQGSYRLVPYHRLEVVDELARFDKHGNAGLAARQSR